MRTESLLHDRRRDLEDAGLRGGFLVRGLHAGDELGIEPDLEFPIASLVKIPPAIAALERMRTGALDGAARISVRPGETTPGSPGLSRFRHPVLIAVEDLLYLSMAVSDNAAADVLFELTPPADVAAEPHRLGLGGIAVRHPMREIIHTPVARLRSGHVDLAQALAIGAGTAGRGHRLPHLDVTRANAGSVRAFVDLLQALWTPSAIHPAAAERVWSSTASTPTAGRSPWPCSPSRVCRLPASPRARRLWGGPPAHCATGCGWADPG